MGTLDKNRHTLTHDQLSNLVEKQSRQLKEMSETLQQVEQEINDELEMAKSVQNSLMPREFPEFLNVEIDAVYIPAGKVGGDFYDIILTPTQKLAILIFDVSGHGVPAALIGAMAKMLFAHYIELIESPAQIFTEVNKKMCNFIKTDHYLTAFLGILDPIQNTMVYSRAGHVRPVVYHPSEKKVSVLASRGFFIGHTALAQIAEYEEEMVCFEPDDKILFYTDGLTEGNNGRDELYGCQRLMQQVKACGDLPVKEFLQHILDNQTAFCRGFALRDDFTMLCVQIGNSEHLLKESGFSKEDAPNVLMVNKRKEIVKASAVILKLMDNHGFTDHEIKRTKVSMYEMIINGLLHGNKNNPEKKVLILYKVLQEKVAISVVDQGNGFDHHRVPNPLDAENLTKQHGRGLFIIKRYMDEVHFNEKGNRILAVKYHKEDE